MELNILTLCYLIGAITFILGLKMLSHPEKARKGNLLAAFGMTVAIFGTIFLYRDDDGNKLHNYGWIFGGIFIGGIIGTLAAKKVKMTAMPEMVSMFNGMGGACAALISVVEFNHLYKTHTTADVPIGTVLIILLGLIIGSISFAGSMIAWGKLNGKVKDFTFKGQHFFNIILLLTILGLAVFVLVSIQKEPIIDPQNVWVTANAPIPVLFLYIVYGIFALSLLYGVFFVFPIGGADMPVVISLLNSFTGVAAACGLCFGIRAT